MASENKKRKAKNSHLYKGNENQKVYKLKRTAYYIKADRKRSTTYEKSLEAESEE